MHYWSFEMIQNFWNSSPQTLVDFYQQSVNETIYIWGFWLPSVAQWRTFDLRLRSCSIYDSSVSEIRFFRTLFLRIFYNFKLTLKPNNPIIGSGKHLYRADQVSWVYHNIDVMLLSQNVMEQGWDSSLLTSLNYSEIRAGCRTNFQIPCCELL